MKFCPDCNNILVIKQEGQTFINRCRVCSYKEKADEDSYRIHFSTTSESESINYRRMISNGICDDITYPLIKYQICKNCHSNKIIFIKDDITLKYVYVCKDCKSYWSNTN